MISCRAALACANVTVGDYQQFVGQAREWSNRTSALAFAVHLAVLEGDFGKARELVGQARTMELPEDLVVRMEKVCAERQAAASPWRRS